MSTSPGAQIDVALNSIFASRKRNPVEEEKSAPVAIHPGNFQVYAKIEEQSRKDNQLVASFLITLNEARGSITYEFRGVCTMAGSSADFESVMGSNKDSRVPKILDIIYQRMYPVVFMLAGMTMSSYPQSIGLLTEMVSSEPIQVHQEAEPLPKHEEQPQIPEKHAATEKPAKTEPEVMAEAPKAAIAKMKKQPQLSSGSVESKPTIVK